MAQLAPEYQPDLRDVLPERHGSGPTTAGQAARLAQAAAEAEAMIARAEQARQHRAQAAHAPWGKSSPVLGMDVCHPPSPLPAAAERYAFEQRQRAAMVDKLQRAAIAKWGSRKAAMRADPGIFCGV